jgi:aspartyl protease family protein
MRWGTILVLAATAAMVGWLAPDLRTAELQLTVAGTSPALTAVKHGADGEARRRAWLSGETVLQREPDGHFYADALVASYRARFLVDTGASIVALTASDAEAMGLEWREDELVAVGRGASGTVYGVPVKLDRVELGAFEARDVQAAIVPEGLGVSLLGQSFLSKLDGVRIEGDRMFIGPAS